MVEACGAGAYAASLPPRSTLLAAARPGEFACAAGYDRRTGRWRSNAFSRSLRRLDPHLTLAAARGALATSVRRSHVVIATRGLDPARVRLGEFLP